MNGFQLALSMFTIFPVRSHDSGVPDRATCGAALRWFPFVGALLALLATLVSLALWRPPSASAALPTGAYFPGDAPSDMISFSASAAGSGSPLLAAVAVVVVFAVCTRGLHLDGLADVADGLGSARPAEEALAVMKRSDIGPFGVVTIVLGLLAQVAALSWILSAGTIWMNAVVLLLAAAAARVAVLHACAAGIMSARPEGFGALVAGTASRRSLVVADLSLAVVAIAGGLLADHSLYGVWSLLAEVVVALAAGRLILTRCVARFGGVTGDVFGAVLEAAMTAALVAFAAVMAVHVR